MPLEDNGIEQVVMDSHLLNIKILLIPSKMHGSVGFAREQNTNPYFNH